MLNDRISTKVCVHVYVWAPLICLGEVLRAGNLESYGICVMNIFRNCQMFCRADRPFWIPTNRVQKCQYLHILVSTQYNVFHFRHTNDCVVLSPDFSLHFLFANEMESLFMWLICFTYAFNWWKVWKSFPFLKLGLFITYFILRVLYISKVQSALFDMTCKDFSPCL